MIASFIVIDSLTNFKTKQLDTLNYISLDNFYNSIKALVFRMDASQEFNLLVTLPLGFN